MLDGGRPQIHTRAHVALVRIAEVGRGVDVHRPALKGRDAAIGDAVVAEVLVVQRDLGLLSRGEGQGGIDTVTVQVYVVAEAAGVFVHGVQAKGNLAAERLIEVRREALVSVRTAHEGDFVQRHKAGLLGDAVDHATAAATAEHHGVRAFEGLHAIEVIEIAVILHVVAHAVHKEIGGGAVAADHQLIAVVLALDRGDSGHVAHDVADAHHHLVFDQLLGYDGDRLRHVAQRRKGLGGAADGLHLISRRFGDGDRLTNSGKLQNELER